MGGVIVALFKRKEERTQDKKELQEKLLDNFLVDRNLKSLSEEDIEVVDEIRQDLESALAQRVRGTEGEIAQTELLTILTEQNWVVIKLLNEIKQKLDKED